MTYEQIDWNDNSKLKCVIILFKIYIDILIL